MKRDTSGMWMFILAAGSTVFGILYGVLTYSPHN